MSKAEKKSVDSQAQVKHVDTLLHRIQGNQFPKDKPTNPVSKKKLKRRVRSLMHLLNALSKTEDDILS